MGFLALRLHQGVAFRTDLMALLPQEEQDPVLSSAIERVTGQASRRLVFLVGHVDAGVAHLAAAAIERDLETAGLARFDDAALNATQLGGFYFPYRHGLLAPADRRLLQEDRGGELQQRALAQVFSVGGISDSRLLAADPFLLLPSFLASLPVPASRLAITQGRLGVRHDGFNWILASGKLAGDPFALTTQSQLLAILDASSARLAAAHPDLRVLRTGAVFFAQSGSTTAIAETTTLGTLSLIGTVLLLLVVFRHWLPLVLNVTAIAVGIGTALAFSLLVFEEVHVVTLLFGVGLIGVSVDYGLHYMASLLDPDAGAPVERLRHVLPGIALGLLTTLIGYVILVLAPFPGLRQIAVFSVVGLCAAFLTVVLWFPLLDRRTEMAQSQALMRATAAWWQVWEGPGYRLWRRSVLAALCLAAVLGLSHLEVDDDVRRMQSLDPVLLAQQAEIQRITGTSNTLQNLLVLAADDEQALRRQEALFDHLSGLKAEGIIGGFRAPAHFIPSLQLQAENRQLVQERLLAPFEFTLRGQLGMAPGAPVMEPDVPLTPELTRGAVAFLEDMIVAPGQHVIALDGVRDVARVRDLQKSFSDVILVDPAGDFSALLAKYRERAVWLVALSAVLMLIPMWRRFGLRGAILVMAPPVMAVLLAPALIALAGGTLSFFNVMALVLVLSIGVDYAIFCAEAGPGTRSGTQLAVALATMTTVLSFGLLSFSRVVAVHAFGLTLLLGVSIAFLLAPMAVGVSPRSRHLERS